MLDQLTLLLATPIAKAVLDKFYEGVGSKLGEKAVELVPDKVKQLGQLVWNQCLRGKPGAQETVQQAASGSAEAQRLLTEQLYQTLDGDDGTLQQDIQLLITEIFQLIQELRTVQTEKPMHQRDQGVPASEHSLFFQAENVFGIQKSTLKVPKSAPVSVTFLSMRKSYDKQCECQKCAADFWRSGLDGH